MQGHLGFYSQRIQDFVESQTYCTAVAVADVSQDSRISPEASSVTSVSGYQTSQSPVDNVGTRTCNDFET